MHLAVASWTNDSKLPFLDLDNGFGCQAAQKLQEIHINTMLQASTHSTECLTIGFQGQQELKTMCKFGKDLGLCCPMALLSSDPVESMAYG
jgi:hypothetical protein